MKTIHVKFVDFYSHFIPENSFFYKILTKNYNVVLSEDPDYLFYSVFGSEHLQYDCIKIFWSGENQSPDFNLCDYAMEYDYITFRDRYLRLPLYYLYYHDYDLMSKKERISPSFLSQKTKFCSFVYSNNYASPERKLFFDQLSEYKPISSGGRFLNNIGGAVADKLLFQQEHKFSIAFENASSPGYTTEKLIQSFAAQTIPIYWGDPEVGKKFNTNSFVNCHDYNSFDEVIDKIKELDNNDELYLQMLQTPALLDPENDLKDAMQKLELFLKHIFDQPLEEAKRYSREYWGRKYINKQRELQKAYNRSLKGRLHKVYLNLFQKIEKNNKNILLWRVHKWLMKLMKKN